MAVQLSISTRGILSSPQFETNNGCGSVSETVETIRTNVLERQSINQKISIAKITLYLVRTALLAAAITSFVFTITFVTASNIPFVLLSLSLIALCMACPSIAFGSEIAFHTYLEKKRKERNDLSGPIPQVQQDLLNEALRTLQNEIDTPPVLDTEEFQARKRQLEATRTELRSFMRQFKIPIDRVG